MSRELYEGLIEGDGELAAEAPMLSALARHARLRRAARELATEELDEGWYVDEEEAPEEATRLAADDGEARAGSYAGGPWKLLVTPSPAGLLVLQQEGPPGGTIEHAGAWAALTPGEGALLAGIDALPEKLLLLGPDGRRWTLTRS